MKKCLWIGLTLSAFLLASCKEEDNIEPTNVSEEETQVTETVQDQEPPIPLKIGNTWIYKRYEIRIDSNGTYTQKELVGTDTIKVLGDTIIGTNTYFILSDCITCGYKTSKNKAEQYLRIEDKTLFSNPKSYNSSGQTGFSLKTNGVHFTEHLDDYYKIDYSSIELNTNASNNSNNIRIDGKLLVLQEDNTYKRLPYSDPYYIIDPTKGIIDSEVYYALSSKEQRVGFKKELVSFQSN